MNTYRNQVSLLVQLLPYIAVQKCFALKGGTAINLFVRDLPRLSVDIDLVYLPRTNRAKALEEIRENLEEICIHVGSNIRSSKVVRTFRQNPNSLRIVVVHEAGFRVKVELSPVLRGVVHPIETMQVSPTVEEEYGYAEMQVVSFADLYAGKICAALDRQHPRDLFDVSWLLATEGISEEIRRTFIVYLVSHNRPISELLQPNLKDLSQLYLSEFADMSKKNVSLESLNETRLKLIETIRKNLSSNEKDFLVSFKKGEPEWQLLGLDGVSDLPAILWKQQNLAKMPRRKHKIALQKLEEILNT